MNYFLEKIKLFILFFWLIAGGNLNLYAQNLVSNNSFESYSLLPNNYGEPCRSTGWFNPNSTCAMVAGTGSPDFMHNLGVYPVSLPNSIFGTCAAHTGSAVMGFGTWSALIANYREYIYTTLSAPMVIGQSYTVSFWLTAGKATYYSYRSNNIGVCFSTSPLIQAGSAPINVIPQCNITTIVKDSVWQLYSFTIVPTAAYTTLTIGNFYSDAATTRVLAIGGSPNAAYYFVDDITVTPSLPLPVELLSFTASPLEASVRLDWSTATELNNDYFTVERSEDAITFETIGKVFGSGTSSEMHDYEFSDNAPRDGVNYYRLLQVDYDGKYQLSPVVPVDFHSTHSAIFSHYNHGNSQLEIAFFTGNGRKVRATLLTLQGQLLKEFFIISDRLESIPVDDISSGIYLLILPEETVGVQKLIF